MEKWENGLVVVPYSLMNSLVKEEHHDVHWGTENFLKHLQKSVISRNMVEAIRSVTGVKHVVGIIQKHRIKFNLEKLPRGRCLESIGFTELPRKGVAKVFVSPHGHIYRLA